MVDRIQIGHLYRRSEVRAVFGGSNQGGIVPCDDAKTVLLYSDPSAGDAYGYFDDWRKDEKVYEYTGTGQRNDQVLEGFNGSILNHAAMNRSLRLFIAHEKPRSGPQIHRYIGEFQVDADDPYRWRVERDVEGNLRDVVVFRLKPNGDDWYDPIDYITPAIQTTVTTWRPGPSKTVAAANSIRQTSTERNSGKSFTRKAVEALEGERPEAGLSSRFENFLLDQRHSVTRFEIRIKGRRSPLFTDLYDATDNILYEVKASTTRDAIRMAIGQLFDYRRHVGVELNHLAIVTPAEPSEDLCGLIESVNFALVYEQEGGGFAGDTQIPALVTGQR